MTYAFMWKQTQLTKMTGLDWISIPDYFEVSALKQVFSRNFLGRRKLQIAFIHKDSRCAQEF